MDRRKHVCYIFTFYPWLAVCKIPQTPVFAIQCPSNLGISSPHKVSASKVQLAFWKQL
jgi:hypothetical protein